MDHSFDHDHTPNGAGTATERDEVHRRLGDFLSTEDTAPPTDAPPTDTGKEDPPDPDATLYTVERHPEDPPAGLKVGVGEHSLLDPDATRVNAVDVGITMQAVEPEDFDPLLEAEYDGLLGIRRGAIEAPALEEAGRLAATEAATDRDVAALTADGLAVADEAARYEADVLPRLGGKAKATKEAHEKAVAERDAFEEKAIDEPTYWTNAGEVEPTPTGGPLHWLAITPERAKVAGVLEIVVGGLVLSGPVGDAISLDFPFANVLVGMALSLMLFLLGWFGGKALAAVELPVRIVAALFVVAAIWIVWRSTTSMDALRTGHANEGKKILTAATLSNIYIAALTSYAASIYGVFQRRRELIASLPTPTDLWRIVRERREAKVIETKHEMQQAEEGLQAGYDHIDERKTTAAGTDGRCRQREAGGITAGVAFETLKPVTGVHVAQEIANRNAAVTAAKLAHTKTRAEAYPHADSTPTIRRPGLQPEQLGGLNMFHKAAIVALLIGAISGLLGSQIALTLGAAAAAVLLLLGLSGWARRRSAMSTAPALPPIKQPVPVSTLPGVEEAPGWKVPPRSTKPKYSTAPNDPDPAPLTHDREREEHHEEHRPLHPLRVAAPGGHHPRRGRPRRRLRRAGQEAGVRRHPTARRRHHLDIDLGPRRQPAHGARGRPASRRPGRALVRQPVGRPLRRPARRGRPDPGDARLRADEDLDLRQHHADPQAAKTTARRS